MPSHGAWLGLINTGNAIIAMLSAAGLVRTFTVLTNSPSATGLVRTFTCLKCFVFPKPIC